MKLFYFGHLKKRDVMERLFSEGLAEGKTMCGSRRRKGMQAFAHWMGNTVTESGGNGTGQEIVSVDHEGGNVREGYANTKNIKTHIKLEGHRVHWVQSTLLGRF